MLKKNRRLFKTAYLFGSVARDEGDEYSDADVILVRDSSKDFFHRVTEVMDIVNDFGAVDLLIYTPEEFARMRETDGFVANVVEEAVEIEGQQEGSRTVVPPIGE